MSKLSPLKSEEVVRRLRKLGFEGPIPGGRHARMIHPVKHQIASPQRKRCECWFDPRNFATNNHNPGGME
jgi:predicted RNA binding protein YcfA (HicA-like mRNA interferase family)